MANRASRSPLRVNLRPQGDSSYLSMSWTTPSAFQATISANCISKSKQSEPSLPRHSKHSSQCRFLMLKSLQFYKIKENLLNNQQYQIQQLQMHLPRTTWVLFSFFAVSCCSHSCTCDISLPFWCIGLDTASFYEGLSSLALLQLPFVFSPHSISTHSFWFYSFCLSLRPVFQKVYFRVLQQFYRVTKKG